MGDREKSSSDMNEQMAGIKTPERDENLPPEWFQTILWSLNEAVFCVDKNWRISCFNRAAEAITGVSREKAIGSPCGEVVRCSICEGACALRYTMETGKPLLNLAVTLINTAGDEIPISISTALLKDKEGRVVGGVETVRDLSLVEDLRRELDARWNFEDIISKSPKMQHLFDMIPTIAESDTTVLLTGESGTGKGQVAEAIHTLSPRKNKPFITINCAAIPETLLESELFGYKSGAFTGARRDRSGRIALAQGGTLFLDEVGDLSPAIQVKLLRVIQDKIYEPLGGVKSVTADVRIVAATNRDLKKLVEENRFRMDLYYRINVISLDLPSLRERMEDVPLLVDYFVARFSRLKGKEIAGVCPDSMDILMSHTYPGNVRELENIIEHSFVLCPGGVIRTNHLPDYLQPSIVPRPKSINEMVDEYEKGLILTALRKNNWNRLQAARQLGIHKTTLFRKIQKLGIILPEQDGRSKS